MPILPVRAQSAPAGAQLTLDIALPVGAVVGDRIVLMVWAASVVATLDAAGWEPLGGPVRTSGNALTGWVVSRRLTAADDASNKVTVSIDVPSRISVVGAVLTGNEWDRGRPIEVPSGVAWQGAAAQCPTGLTVSLGAPVLRGVCSRVTSGSGAVVSFAPENPATVQPPATTATGGVNLSARLLVSTIQAPPGSLVEAVPYSTSPAAVSTVAWTVILRLRELVGGSGTRRGSLGALANSRRTPTSRHLIRPTGAV